MAKDKDVLRARHHSKYLTAINSLNLHSNHEVGVLLLLLLFVCLLLLFSNEVGIKVIGPKRMGKR